eukprot:TRINITY_DN9007_c0_g1_i1.p1 TRINITY_DN9007_c0_g1~~TRINITY_DN9007_c0_g1_i1.p1  ORF type:complete len:179 (-),score=46.06 TRINITY_DN9007_c0_g1_i1:125-661(-)
MQQGFDANPGEAGTSNEDDRWADLLLPRQADAAIDNVGATAVTSPVTSGVSFSIIGDVTLAAPGDGIAVGPDDMPSDVGVQADYSYPPEALPDSTLPAEDLERMTDFLRGLQRAHGAADSSTLNELMQLLGSLPKPEGPRVLLGAIRLQQPALFQRLHESMRRTQQRTGGSATAAGGS